jgi:cephalosporin hydroxylase
VAAERRASPSPARRIRGTLRDIALTIWDRTAANFVARLYQFDLIYKTGNFRSVTWLGKPVWQNVLDLWTIQEAIAEIRPALLIETGTDHGGSALFYASLMDLLGEGRVITVDIVKRHDLDHPRIEFIQGSSTDDAVVDRLRGAVEKAGGPVMVVLDSDHSQSHVAKELELYTPLVTPGSVLISQDGVIDQLRIFRSSRPGPLRANREFLDAHPEFEHDRERNERFRLTHHPLGWLRRRPDGQRQNQG